MIACRTILRLSINVFNFYFFLCKTKYFGEAGFFSPKLLGEGIVLGLQPDELHVHIRSAFAKQKSENNIFVLKFELQLDIYTVTQQ